MMNKIIAVLVLCVLSFQLSAQNSNERTQIELTCMNYLEGFYEGDTSKIISSLNPTLYKFGYWKNDKTGEYDGDSHMTFEEAVSYAKRVFEKKKFTSDEAPKQVEILHIAQHIAAAKVTAWWGIDYVLLAKNNNHWQIEQVLWEGSLVRSHIIRKLKPYEENKTTSSFQYGKISPDAPRALLDYSDLIGQCDCISTRANAQGEFNDTTQMVWQFKYIMNGMAIQDESWKSDEGHTSSIRQFNQDSLQWHVTFFSMKSPTATPTTWSGSPKNDKGDIILKTAQKAPNGIDGFSILTFYNISDAGFKWKGVWEDTSGQFKFPFWKIDCKKRIE